MKYFSKVFPAVSIAILILSMLTSADAAIGIYKTPQQIPSLPAPVSYMLNTDANDTSNGWSLKIEIAPQYGGPPVRTYKFLYPALETLKGMHSNAVVWDGKRDDGTPAPLAEYKAVITAKAAPVTGNNLVPLWESTAISTTAWRDAAINRNQSSLYYGCVYAVNMVLKNVYLFEPDGSSYSLFTAKSSNLWNGTAPSGIDIASDDNVWISSYTNSLLDKFNPDGSLCLWEGRPMGNSYKNPRFLAVSGSGQNWKATETLWNFGLPTSMKLLTYNGSEPPSTLFTETALDWPLMEPEFGPDGSIAVCAYSSHNSQTGGAIAKYAVNGSLLAENPGIRRGVGLAYSPDGYYIWVSRYVDNSSADYADPDTTAIYKISATQAFTIANPDTGVGVEKLGIYCAGSSKQAYTVDCDPFGNIVAVTGLSNGLVQPSCTHIGVYAPPDNGSVAVREITIQPWACIPRITDCSITPDRVCAGKSTIATVTALVEDCDADVVRCVFTWPEAGFVSGIFMNLISHSGTHYTYQCIITVPVGVSTGIHRPTVCAYDAHYPSNPSICRELQFEVDGDCVPCCLGCAKQIPEELVIIDCMNSPLIVTYVDTISAEAEQKWFYVETPDRSAAVKVSAGSLHLPLIWPGSTVARLKGVFMSDNDGCFFRLYELPVFTQGPSSNIPKPLGVSNLNIGRGLFGCAPAMTDRGVGLNADALLVKVYGKVTRIEPDSLTGEPAVVFIDDGSGVASAITSGGSSIPFAGLKCYITRSPIGPTQPIELSVGDYVLTNGIASSEWLNGIGRIRTLKLRYCRNPFSGEEICDRFEIASDVP